MVRNVYHINEINENRFYKLPKQLFLNTYYNKLSSNAKILYAVLSDRMELSRKNNWVNEEGEVFLLFTRENIAKLLNISKPTATKIFKELRNKELIYEEKQGFDKANRIFIGKIDYSKGEMVEEIGKKRNLTTRLKGLTSNIKKFYPSDTELNETEYSETKSHNGVQSKKQDSTPHFSFYSDKIQNLLNNYNMSDYIYENVVYYLRKYKQHKGKDHPELKLDQWNRVFSNITSTGDPDYDREFELIEDRFKAVADQHFVVNYSQEIDHNILHIISGDVMKNRAYEVAY